MKTAIQVLGVIIAVMGLLYLLKPKVLHGLIDFFKKGSRIYLVGLARFALAIVFLLAARECDLTWVIVVFGILFLVSGIVIFGMGLRRVKALMEWYQGQSPLLLRFVGLIVLAVGIVIMYAA